MSTAYCGVGRRNGCLIQSCSSGNLKKNIQLASLLPKIKGNGLHFQPIYRRGKSSFGFRIVESKRRGCLGNQREFYCWISMNVWDDAAWTANNRVNMCNSALENFNFMRIYVFFLCFFFPELDIECLPLRWHFGYLTLMWDVSRIWFSFQFRFLIKYFIITFICQFFKWN